MAGDPGITASLVIVTYNRRDELLRLIESMDPALHRSDIEFVLVDDASTDGTVEAVESAVEFMGDRARIIRQDKDGPGAGRNRGIAAARGEIIVFVDTDCVVHDGWIESLLEPFADHEVGAVGGPDRSSPDDPLLIRMIDYLMTAFLTTGGVRGSKKAAGGSYHPRSFNMAVRRQAALDARGFPLIWYGEDILLSWRIRNSGWKLEFAPDAWLFHRRRTTYSGWARQLFRMGRARWWMGRYDSNLLDPIYVLPLAEWLIGVSAVTGIAAGGTARTVGVGTLAIAGTYLLAMGLDGMRKTRSIAASLAVPFLFLLRETAYACGSLAGLIRPVPDMTGKLETE
jgi:GT2 family glycosyltransferase